jgi:hypothetical protein
MHSSRLRSSVLGMLFGTGAVVLEGCLGSGPVGEMVSDCFGENTISPSEYDDLDSWEQLLYEENDCGTYEPVSSVLDDLL